MTTTTFAAVETNSPSNVAPETSEFAATGSTQPTTPAAPLTNDSESQRGFAITSFVLGIASVVAGWTFVAPVIGFVLGLIALRRGTTERALALWGVWINGVILALAAIGIFLVAALVSAGVLTLPFFLA